MNTQFSEDSLVQKYFLNAAFSSYALGLKDDAACLHISEGCELVVTTDTIISGVHFFENDPVWAIAQKALRVNLSDLVAKGAQPVGFVMSLALPKLCFTHEWLYEFSNALTKDAILFKCPLLGGNTTKSLNELSITITAFGEVPAGKMVKRTTANAGDILYVTGTIGDAALGLYTHPSSNHLGALNTLNTVKNTMNPLLKAEDEVCSRLEYRRLVPQPRFELAPILQKFATAALDISDGFAGDCMKLLSFSNLGIEIQCEQLPLSEEAKALLGCSEELSDEVTSTSYNLDHCNELCTSLNDTRTLWQIILSGGDDYEILFTISPENEDNFLYAAQKMHFNVKKLGVTNLSNNVIFTINSEPIGLKLYSYSHLV